MRALASPRVPTSAEVEVEQCVVALLLEGSEVAWAVLDLVDKEDFIEPIHGRILDTARRVLDSGGTITALTLNAAMGADEALEELGGSEYFRIIASRSGRNAEICDELCQALVDQAKRRALAQELAETETRLGDQSISAGDLLASHEEAIRALVEGRPAPDEPSSWYEAGARVIESIELGDLAASRARLQPFGIPALDDVVGGMAGGDFVIIAGRPGMGKTALAIQIALAAARPKQQVDMDLGEASQIPPVGVFMASLEMKRDALVQRGLSMLAYERGARVPYTAIRNRKLPEGAQDGLVEAFAGAGQLPFIIDDRRGLTVGQIGVRARRAAAKFRREGKKLGLLLIDHLGLIEGDRRNRGSRVDEVTETTKGLKTLAGALDVPIITLSQLSRRVEEREDKRPYLSDLRDSGSIEQDADVVIFVHRMEYYLIKSRPRDDAPAKQRDEWEAAMDRAAGKVDLLVAKNRSGPEAEITLRMSIAHNWIGEQVKNG